MNNIELKEADCCYNCINSKNEYAWSRCKLLKSDDILNDDTVGWHQVCDNFEKR